MYVKQAIIDYEVDKMLRLMTVTLDIINECRAKVQLLFDLQMITPDIYDKVMSYLDLREDELHD